MSIAKTYQSEFKIVCYDEDIQRGQKLEKSLRQQGYNFSTFSSRGMFLQSLEVELPHMFILYYQPLNLKFRQMLSAIREKSSEVEVILLGGNQFWPGIENLLNTHLIDDFWSWPMADFRVMEMRLNQLIEKTVYKYIGEQRSKQTAQILSRLEKLEERQESFIDKVVPVTSLKDLQIDDLSSENKIVESLITQLKKQFPSNDFVFLKNYPAREQLLITHTSFASQNYFRGQNLPFNRQRLDEEPVEAYNQLRLVLEETFNCETFLMAPVQLGQEFYGLVMAVHFDDMDYLQKTCRYVALNLRNLSLEAQGLAPDRDLQLNIELSPSQFPLSLSNEISRARRLKKPVSLVVTHLEYVRRDGLEMKKAKELIRNNLRGYDFICQLDEQQIAFIMPHCSYESAAIKAETIRRQLVARGLKTQNTPLRLCFGVSEFPSLSADSDSLFVDSKKACSQVLVSGKNKVCLYTKPEGFTPEFLTQTDATI